MLKKLAQVTLATVLMSVFAAPNSAIALPLGEFVPVRPSPDDVYIDQRGNVIPVDEFGIPMDNPNPDAAEQERALPPCTPVSGVDNPHRSSTGVAASGHGWWDQGDCSSNRAVVYNCLYMQHDDGYWYQKACSQSKELKPGGGSSHRTVARRDCAGTAVRQWRNHVDVDVVGEWDTAEKPMRQAAVACVA